MNAAIITFAGRAGSGPGARAARRVARRGRGGGGRFTLTAARAHGRGRAHNERSVTPYEEWSRAGWAAHLPGVTDIAGYVASLGEATIPGLAAASADRVPDRVALSVDGDRITHAELNAAAAQIAAWLATRLAPGGRVLLAARSSLGFVRCYLGALRAGATVVLANPGYTAAELAHLVADSGAAIAFADSGPARLLAGLPNPPLTVDTAEVPTGPPGNAAIVPGPGDTALLAYTSGTTGRPKAVPLTHRALLISIRVAMASWGWREDDVLAHALPLFHQHGLGGVHAVLIAGGSAHIASRFTAEGLASAVRQHATVLFAVPTMYQALLDDGQRFCNPGPSAPRSASPDPAAPPHGRLLAGLRLAVCGSAPLTALLAERSATELGRAPLVRYGLTETGLNVSHIATDIRPGSVGIPFPGVLVRLWAESAPAPPGAVLLPPDERGAARTSSVATRATHRPPPSPSPPTAGSAPATSAAWTPPRAIWSSAAAARR